MFEISRYDENILVKELIDNFSSQGLEIQSANYGGFSKPSKVKNNIPDVVGWDSTNKLLYFGKVKGDKKNIENVNTSEQFYELSNLVMNDGPAKGKVCPFYIAVPKKYLATLHKKLIDLGISKRNNVHTLGI